MSDRDLAITFAGGGNRAFYQMGLMNVWFERLAPRVRCLATCSAGACVAALMLSGREQEVGEYWRERCREVTKNFEWRRLLALKRPTPHEPLYRDMLLQAFAEGGLERIRAQPFPVLVLTTAFPRALPAAAAVALALFTYNLEKRLRDGMLHPTYGRRAGFKALAFDARDCRTPRELADLIIASSATPPFTSVGSYAGRRLLDGGVVDNAPAFLAEELPEVTRNLVMLTRPYPSALVGRQGARFYVAPREPLPIERWDFTRPDLLEATVRIGEQDAARLTDALSDFLA
ncbi:MAG TPA: patatin-like phospholipase family protein [Pyrinomonadaceae bacterium]|nr:patatin-like phospholipase family protein [Pyrinomonadaceae bacterium]